MAIRIRGVVDVQGERNHWRQLGGLPEHPYSETWDVLVGIAASVFVTNPYGGMDDWMTAIRSKLHARGAMIPDAEVDAVSRACLQRLDAVPEHGAMFGQAGMVVR